MSDPDDERRAEQIERELASTRAAHERDQTWRLILWIVLVAIGIAALVVFARCR